MEAERKDRLQSVLVRAGTVVWLALGVVVLASAVRSLLPRPAVAGPVSSSAPASGVHLPAPGDSTAAYKPAYRLVSGRERVMIFVGASFCGAHREPGFPEAVERVKTRLQQDAQRSGATFRAIAVSLDWEPDSALAFLKPFGRWEELSVGGNWTNELALRFLWSGPSPEPTVPQVIVLERDVQAGASVRVSAPRELHRVVGAIPIRRWADSGAPL